MTESNGEDPDLLLHRAPAEPEGGDDAAPRPALRRRGWIIAGILVGVPLLLTLAGALTAPPHARSVPVGHLVYLEADEPSDHTAILRGLRLMGPDGASRQMLHETEPQDTDSGSREWITQPKASPDGRWLAFEKQIITLQDEKQAVDNQLWVMPLNASQPPPRMALDLTKQRLEQFVGLAWTPDSKQIVFLNGCDRYGVGPAGGGTQAEMAGCVPSTAGAAISTTRHPALSAPGLFAYDTRTPTGAAIRVSGGAGDALLSYPHQAAPVWALSADGRLAVAPAGRGHVIEIQDTTHQAGSRTLAARWGWSVFGGQHITALQWSPDGKLLAYSVSKPPFEDELFYLDPTTGRCSQLPVRTGRAGWDWTP